LSNVDVKSVKHQTRNTITCITMDVSYLFAKILNIYINTTIAGLKLTIRIFKFKDMEAYLKHE
jgi:hypothetical protein